MSPHLLMGPSWSCRGLIKAGLSGAQGAGPTWRVAPTKAGLHFPTCPVIPAPHPPSRPGPRPHGRSRVCSMFRDPDVHFFSYLAAFSQVTFTGQFK